MSWPGGTRSPRPPGPGLCPASVVAGTTSLVAVYRSVTKDLRAHALWLAAALTSGLPSICAPRRPAEAPPSLSCPIQCESSRAGSAGVLHVVGTVHAARCPADVSHVVDGAPGSNGSCRTPGADVESPLQLRVVSVVAPADDSPRRDKRATDSGTQRLAQMRWDRTTSFYLQLHGWTSLAVARRGWPMAPKNGPHFCCP
jgi:hypothetical protein